VTLFRLRPNGRIYVRKKRPIRRYFEIKPYENVHNSRSYATNSNTLCNAWRQQHRSD